MTFNRKVQLIETEEGEWMKLFDLHLADWLCRKSRYLLAACIEASFYVRVVKETEKAMQFEVSRFGRDGNEYKLYHRWTFWSPKSAIGAMSF